MDKEDSSFALLILTILISSVVGVQENAKGRPQAIILCKNKGSFVSRVIHLYKMAMTRDKGVQALLSIAREISGTVRVI